MDQGYREHIKRLIPKMPFTSCDFMILTDRKTADKFEPAYRKALAEYYKKYHGHQTS